MHKRTKFSALWINYRPVACMCVRSLQSQWSAHKQTHTNHCYEQTHQQLLNLLSQCDYIKF